MRTLSSATETAVTSAITSPVFLIELGWSPTLYLSSRGDVTWDGTDYTGGNVEVKKLSQSGNGNVTGELEFLNLNNTYSSLILNQGARDISVDIWVADASALSASDPVKVFSGTMDGAKIGDRCLVSITSESEWLAVSPRIFCSPPVFNFMPSDGTRIYWAGSYYTLDRR
jgi:hypothetical protein